MKELLSKRFEWKTGPVAPPPQPPDMSRMTAPPFIDTKDPAEADRLRKLLFQRFSMTDIRTAAKSPVTPEPTPEPTPAPAAETEPVPSKAEVHDEPGQADTSQPAAAISIKDLLSKRFEWKTGPVAPPPQPPDMSRMTAPPFIDTKDPAEADRLRKLLFQRFSMTDIRTAAKPPVTPEPTPEPTPAPAAETEPVPEPTPEPEPVPEPIPEPTLETPPTETSEPAPEKPVRTTAAAAETQIKTEPAPPFQTAQPQVGIKPQPEEMTLSRPQNRPSDLPPGSSPPPPDPVMRYFKIGGVFLGIIAALLLWSSFSNSSKYYITAQKEGLTVFQGAFSPMGKRTLATLSGRQMDDPLQPVYSRKEIFPLLFTYYLDRADAMLNASGLLDFAAIQAKLDDARRYALDQDMRAAVRMRSNTLERTQLIHRAHVEISKGTPASMETALGHLKRALRMSDDAVQMEAINQIIALIEEQKARMPAR